MKKGDQKVSIEKEGLWERINDYNQTNTKQKKGDEAGDIKKPSYWPVEAKVQKQRDESKGYRSMDLDKH